MRFVFVGIFVASVIQLNAQHIFDKPHTLAFCNYLVQNKEYQFAIDELSKVQSDSLADSVDLLVLKATLEIGSVDTLFMRVNQVLRKPQVPGYLLHFMQAICIYNDSFNLCARIGSTEKIPPELELNVSLLKKDLVHAAAEIKLYKDEIDTGFYAEVLDQLVRINARKTKKILPIVASVILPGSGKMLIGETYDGLFAMAFTGLYTALAVRSYQTYGLESFFGAANVLAATLFYGGNIVGTQRSIHRKSRLEIKRIHEKIKTNLYHRFLLL